MHSISRAKGLHCICVQVANRAMCSNTYLQHKIRAKIVSVQQSGKALLNDLNMIKMVPPHRNFNSVLTIKNDGRFFYIETEGLRAELEYFIEDGIMEIRHTRVPNKLGGHGLGKLLAKTALDFAVQNKLFLTINCKFVKVFVNDNEPQYLKYILH
ncbi:protein NATD1 [Drosophila busckii]|uniref:protein NATD1 n=1 Tax=Drosophila busckii TaxID=30019 RepID=UPI00083EFC49|nr:protein NATD1 [Drosophila busckii]XP_017846394.1 protein NATD1 [Drosophila busckii]